MSIPSPVPVHPATSSVQPARPTARLWIAAGVLALVAAALWGAWLGWDRTYQVVDGVQTGPYTAWQVIGCGACVVLATVVARFFARHWLAVLVLPPLAATGFAIPWTIDAARADDSGLFAVGAVMLWVGATIGLGFVLAVVEGGVALVRAARRR